MRRWWIYGAGMLLAVVAGLACNGDGSGLMKLSIAGQGAPERVPWTITRGDRTITDVITLPYNRNYRVDHLHVVVSTPTGAVSCVITLDGEVVGRDVNPDRRVADCEASK
jgi:hypothetical protein